MVGTGRMFRHLGEINKGNVNMDADRVQGYGVTHTLEETARLLGITRERVRQIEKQALKKLRMQLRIRYGVTSLSGIL